MIGATFVVLFLLSFLPRIESPVRIANTLAQETEPAVDRVDRTTVRKPAILDSDSDSSTVADSSDANDDLDDPDLPTPRQIVDRHILASGGHEVLSSIETLQLYWEGDKATVESYSKPGQLAIKFFQNGNVYLERRVTGDIAWMSSQGTPSLLPAKSRQAYLRRAQVLPADSWFVSGSNATVVGIVVVDGKSTYQLNYLSADKVETEKFFDVETGLLSRTKRIEYTIEPAGVVTVRDSLDYQWFGDIYYPVVSRITTGSHVTQYRLLEMIVNEEIPEDMFEVTDEIQAFLTAQQRIHDRQKRK
jgi:hypothetical protein